MTLPIDRHERAALWYSGGKDSTAALWSLRRYWHKIAVLWSNAGDEYPETIALMDRVRAEVPHFLEIKSDAPAHIAEHGWPVDMLPLTHTRMGRELDGHAKPLMQPFFECCYANRVRPLWEATVGIGATLVIRGERHGEQRRSVLRDGHVEQGVEFWLPIYGWTEDQVFAFLRKENAPLSPGYRLSPTSLDCQTCTAWLQSGGLGYLRETYPERYAEVTRRLKVIREAYARELALTDATLAGERIPENQRAADAA